MLSRRELAFFGVHGVLLLLLAVPLVVVFPEMGAVGWVVINLILAPFAWVLSRRVKLGD